MFATIVEELFHTKDQRAAKAEPLWAFLGGWAVNIVAWIVFVSVGGGPINLFPFIICVGAIAAAILFIRPVNGKWKYLAIVSIFDCIWMLVWVFI